MCTAILLDIFSLTTVASLETVTVHLVTSGSNLETKYKRFVEYIEAGDAAPYHRRFIAAVNEEWGLKTWFEKGFRANGSVVNIRCFHNGIMPSTAFESLAERHLGDDD